MYVSLCVCAHMCWSLWNSEEGIRSPRVGVSRGGKLKSGPLCKSSKCSKPLSHLSSPNCRFIEEKKEQSGRGLQVLFVIVVVSYFMYMGVLS